MPAAPKRMLLLTIGRLLGSTHGVLPPRNADTGAYASADTREKSLTPAGFLRFCVRLGLFTDRLFVFRTRRGRHWC